MLHLFHHVFRNVWKLGYCDKLLVIPNRIAYQKINIICLRWCWSCA